MNHWTHTAMAILLYGNFCGLLGYLCGRFLPH